MIELPLLIAAFLVLVAWPENKGQGLCFEPADRDLAEPRGGAA